MISGEGWSSGVFTPTICREDMLYNIVGSSVKGTSHKFRNSSLDRRCIDGGNVLIGVPKRFSLRRLVNSSMFGHKLDT